MRWLRLLAAWLPIAVLVSILPVYACYLVQPAVGAFHDDGIYLVNALSLVSGHGFRTLSLPDELFQTKYPFLYPAVLAALWKLFPAFPGNLLLFKLVSLFATAFWAYSTYRLALRETNNPLFARWIGVLLLSLPWVVFLSTVTMPEALFAATSTMSLLMFDQKGDAPTGRRLVGGAVLASVAFLLRSAGLALILSWLFLLLKRQKWRPAFAFFLVVAALTGPWLIWQAMHPATNDFVGAYYTKLNYQGNSVLSSRGPADGFRVIALNAITAVASSCPLGGVRLGLISSLLSLAAGLICIVGSIAHVRKHGLTLPVVWLAVNTGMIVCMMFGLVRYQAPLFAVSLVLFANGALLIARRITRRADAILLLLFAVCAAANVADLFTLRKATLGQETPTWTLSPADSWPETMQAMSWLGKNISTDAVVAANCDPTVFLYTRRKAIRLFNQDNYKLFFDASPGKLPLGSSERLKSHLKSNRISYILMTPMAHYPEAQFLRDQLASLRRARPAAFRVEKTFDDPEFYILSVDRSKL
jgi:hypothetical protein